MKTFTSVLAMAALSAVHAHTIFQEFYVNGVDQGHEVGIRFPSYDGPITDVTSDDLICNGGINPYVTPLSQVVMTVPAGSPVTAEFHHTLAGLDPSDSQDPIDPSHKGPVIAYLAPVESALQATDTGLSWFKIYEDGLDVGNQTWGVDRLIANHGKVTFEVPSCVQSGQYFLRVEIIALHAASTYPGAQFYMECAQIEITGGGNASPATVSFPGAYASTDPGITIDIYQTLPSYTIPGPAVFTCGGTSSSPSAPAPIPSSSVVPSVTPTPVPVPSSSAAPAPSSSVVSSGTQVEYGQCGGTGYTGPTLCASGLNCVAVSAPYYYQCQAA